MTISVILVSYGSQNDIVTCIEALKAQTYRDFRIIIVENAGSINYQKLLDKLLQKNIINITKNIIAPPESRISNIVTSELVGFENSIHIAESKNNLGYAGAVNDSIKIIRAIADLEDILILNPDARPSPAALQALQAYMYKYNHSIVGGRLINSKTDKVQMYGGKWRKWIARGYNVGLNFPADRIPDNREIERQIDYVSGACMLVSREFVDSIGPMKEEYFLYNEEVDWCFRRAGRTIGYAHDAVVFHSHGSTIGSSEEANDRSHLSIYLDERNKLLFSRNFFSGMFPIISIITLVLTSYYLYNSSFKSFRIALKGWYAGMLGETGVPKNFSFLLTSSESQSEYVVNE